VDPRGIRDVSAVVVTYEAASAVREGVRWLGSVKQDIHTPLFLSRSLSLSLSLSLSALSPDAITP